METEAFGGLWGEGMRTIISIEHIEERKDKMGRPYWRTHAIVTDDMGNKEEAVGWGKDYDLGDKVEFFHDDQWNQNKMQHPESPFRKRDDDIRENYTPNT